jgi:hypothetical protein
MCGVMIENFTMTTLLRDPLVQMAMRSDGVSEEYLAELLFRIKSTTKNMTTVAFDPMSSGSGPSEETEDTLTEADAETGFTPKHASPTDTVGEWIMSLAEG